VRRHSYRAGSLAALLAVALGLTLVSPPAFAGQPTAAKAKATPTLAAAVAAQAQALTATQAQRSELRAQTAMGAQTSTEQKPFLKTTKGVVAVLAFVVVGGYAAYSLSHDRVKSPIR
jgi:hypothetical protein